MVVELRLLDRPNPAMATIFGTGLMQDLLEVTRNAPLRQRGITPHSTTDWNQGTGKGPRVDAGSIRSQLSRRKTGTW